MPFFFNRTQSFQTMVSLTPDFTLTAPAQGIISIPVFKKRTSILHRWHSSYQTSNDVCLETSQNVCKNCENFKTGIWAEGKCSLFSQTINEHLLKPSLFNFSFYLFSSNVVYMSIILKTVTKFLFRLLHPYTAHLKNVSELHFTTNLDLQLFLWMNLMSFHSGINLTNIYWLLQPIKLRVSIYNCANYTVNNSRGYHLFHN